MEPIKYFLIVVFIIAAVVIIASFRIKSKWSKENEDNIKITYKKKRK